MAIIVAGYPDYKHNRVEQFFMIMLCCFVRCKTLGSHPKPLSVFSMGLFVKGVIDKKLCHVSCKTCAPCLQTDTSSVALIHHVWH